MRMQNVSTKRRDRINSDEEERTRTGYDLITAVRLEAVAQPQHHPPGHGLCRRRPRACCG